MNQLQRRYAAQLEAHPIRPCTRLEIQKNRAKVIRAARLLALAHAQAVPVGAEQQPAAARSGRGVG